MVMQFIYVHTEKNTQKRQTQRLTFKQSSLKEELKWEISKIQLKNISRHRTQNVDPRQPDHGKHVAGRMLLFQYMYRCRSLGWIISGDRTKG